MHIGNSVIVKETHTNTHEPTANGIDWNKSDELIKHNREKKQLSWTNENKSDREPVKIIRTAAAEIKNILKFY